MTPTTKARAIKTFTHPLYFLALGFGSGLSRWMPGTVGSLAAIPVFLLFQPLGLVWQLVIIAISFVAGIAICDWVAKDMEIKDPGCIVWDEFVGLWITYLLLPPGWYWLVVGFFYCTFWSSLEILPRILCVLFTITSFCPIVYLPNSTNCLVEKVRIFMQQLKLNTKCC
mgnify:CR=1 FL=1